MEPGNSKDNAKAAGIDEQATGEIEGVTEGEEATQVPCTYLPPVQLTPVQGKPTRGLVTVCIRPPSSSTALQSMSTAPHISNPTPNLHHELTTPLPCPIPFP